GAARFARARSASSTGTSTRSATTPTRWASPTRRSRPPRATSLQPRTDVSGRLAEKVCVVTGTGGSMGRATALAFAGEGASVVGCDVAVEPAEATVEMVRNGGGEMVSIHPCRLTDPAQCQKLVELAVSTFGRIDVLFNLAAA